MTIPELLIEIADQHRDANAWLLVYWLTLFAIHVRLGFACAAATLAVLIIAS